MLYQGLKFDKFYWEFFNTLRKLLLLSISVLMSSLSLYLRSLAATIVLIIIFKIQNKLNPYRSMTNNRLESCEILTGAMTTFSLIIFQDQENSVTVINLIVVVYGKLYKILSETKMMLNFIVIILNTRFMLLWTYFMLQTQRKYAKARQAMKFISMIL